MMWFLVLVATGQYLGPMPIEPCANAAAAAHSAGLVCMMAKSSYACPVDGRTGHYTVCYDFSLPAVTKKEGQ